jgi:hypothetical protein
MSLATVVTQLPSSAITPVLEARQDCASPGQVDPPCDAIIVIAITRRPSFVTTIFTGGPGSDVANQRVFVPASEVTTYRRHESVPIGVTSDS